MPLEVNGTTARLSGHAEITEAEPLLDFLRNREDGVVDLSACRSAHMAVMQVLLALRPQIDVAQRPDRADWRHLLAQSGLTLKIKTGVE